MSDPPFAPFVCNPLSYDRSGHWDYAVGLAVELARLNGFPLPRLERADKIPSSSRRFYGECTYARKLIRVAYPFCKNPVRVPVRSWTFPGWKSDLTVGGVLSHELGHWVDYQMGWLSRSRSWLRVLRLESPLTSYEPSPEEAWAESFRLFSTNPGLLLEGRPLRYGFISEAGLKPAFSTPWQEILSLAHPRFHEVARKWVRP